jgi:hypothetical protein
MNPRENLLPQRLRDLGDIALELVECIQKNDEMDNRGLRIVDRNMHSLSVKTSAHTALLVEETIKQMDKAIRELRGNREASRAELSALHRGA